VVKTNSTRAKVYYAAGPPSPDGYVGVSDSPDGSRMIGVAQPAGWIREADGQLSPLFRIGVGGWAVPGAWACRQRRFVEVVALAKGPGVEG
jgi:hypothetical protein